jgi:hypothetical protein
VREHQRAVDQVEHVELDRLGTRGDRRLERAQRVLRREQRGTPVTDPDRRAVSAQQPH